MREKRGGKREGGKREGGKERGRGKRKGGRKGKWKEREERDYLLFFCAAASERYGRGVEEKEKQHE